MDSSDRMIVVIGGKEYRIDGDTLRPSESKFEREVLRRLDGIEARQGRMEARLDSMDARQGRMEARQGRMEARLDKLDVRVGNLEALTVSMHEEVAVLRERSDMTLWAMGIGFALLAAIVTFVGVYVPHLLNSGKSESKPAPSSLSVSDVLTLIDNKLANFTPKPPR